MSDEIKVLIADDHPIFRKGLRAVIESDSLLKVIAESDDGKSALSQIEQLEPDIAVLDVDMPLADGLTVAQTIRSKGLATHAIFLTMHKDEALFNASLEADVKGFIVKDSAATEIVTCIKTVMKGQSFFSSVLSSFFVTRHTACQSLLDNLTTSERRILRLIAEGKASRDIADKLFISIRTVEHHRAHISSKLELKGKNALLTFALTNRNKI